MNQKYKKGDIVISDKDWMEIIEINGKVRLKHIQGNGKDKYVSIEEIEEVEINAEVWYNKQFQSLFTFHGDVIDDYYQAHCKKMRIEKKLTNEDEIIDFISHLIKEHNFKEHKNSDNKIRHLIQSLYYSPNFEPKILFKERELKGFKKAIIEEGKSFFLNQLQNYLEDNPKEEVDISEIIDQINKPKSK